MNDVDLYSGTKHSSVTAFGQLMTPEQIQRGATGHTSDAFKRFNFPDINEAKHVRKTVTKIQIELAKHSQLLKIGGGGGS